MLIKTADGYKSLTVLLFQQFELNEFFDVGPDIDPFIKLTLWNAQPILKIVGENLSYDEEALFLPLIPKKELFQILRDYRTLLTVRMKVGYPKIGVKKYTVELLHKMMFEDIDSNGVGLK